MTIIASNSITVSNVNDGTITHYAYAYSADGTDRFTTTYPNLNLLVNSSAKTKDGFFKDFGKVENGYGEVTLEGNNGWGGRSLFDGFSIYPRDYKPGDKYTMSMDIMFTSWNFPAGTYLDEFWMGQRYTYGGGIWSWKSICTINLPRDPSKMLNQWIRITNTSTIPPYEDPAVNTETILSTIFRGPSEASFTMRVRNPKLEQGSTATPHMPSSSEVTTADYPSYIGQYTDSNVESSSDYSKYQWAIFKGQNSNAYTAYSWSSDGSDRFSTVYPNLNLLDGTSNSFIMGYGIPNTTWDATNQVSKISLPLTVITGEVLPQGTGFPYMYAPNVTYTQSIYISTDAPLTGTPISFTWFTNEYGHNTSGVDNLVKISTNVYRATSIYTWSSSKTSANGRNADIQNLTKVFDFTKGTFLKFYKPKLELGSTATPWMPSESEFQDQWQDAIPMYVGLGEKDSQNPSDYRWQLNPRYVQASSDNGLSSKAGIDDLASVGNTANDALVQAQNAVSNEDYTSWLEHDYQNTIDNLQEISAQNQDDIKNVDDRTTIVEGFYGEMKVKWNFIDESFSFSEEGMFISNAQSKMSIQITSDKIVFWDNNVDVAFITGEVLNIQKGVFLESATIGNHLITKFSDDSPVTIIRYVGGIT